MPFVCFRIRSRLSNTWIKQQGCLHWTSTEQKWKFEKSSLRNLKVEHTLFRATKNSFKIFLSSNHWASPKFYGVYNRRCWYLPKANRFLFLQTLGLLRYGPFDNCVLTLVLREIKRKPSAWPPLSSPRFFWGNKCTLERPEPQISHWNWGVIVTNCDPLYNWKEADKFVLWQRA